MTIYQPKVIIPQTLSCHLELSIFFDGEQWEQSENIDQNTCKQQSFTSFTTKNGK